ncbi:ATP-binding protein [Veillonella parvula]|uniref:ATP-binding protein n=1 Tax=Veillonella parvula TaxID=29466 RepID=UPI002E798D54|nr:ATP-binding protein [Veillonella parvula]
MISSATVLDYLKLPEDEYHDFKQRWHNDNSELVRDILNFVNTVHYDDCYIFFRVADDGTIIGVNEDINRKDSETLTDLLHKLYLSTNSQIKVEVDTQLIDDKEIDILTIFNTNLVPIYFTKEYKPKGTRVSKHKGN